MERYRGGKLKRVGGSGESNSLTQWLVFLLTRAGQWRSLKGHHRPRCAKPVLTSQRGVWAVADGRHYEGLMTVPAGEKVFKCVRVCVFFISTE